MAQYTDRATILEHLCGRSITVAEHMHTWQHYHYPHHRFIVLLQVMVLIVVILCVVCQLCVKSPYRTIIIISYHQRCGHVTWCYHAFVSAGIDWAACTNDQWHRSTAHRIVDPTRTGMEALYRSHCIAVVNEMTPIIEHHLTISITALTHHLISWVVVLAVNSPRSYVTISIFGLAS